MAIGSQGFLEEENIRIGWLVDFGEDIDFHFIYSPTNFIADFLTY